MHCPLARHRSPLLRSSRPIRASERCGLRGIPPYRLHVTWPSRPSPLATVESLGAVRPAGHTATPTSRDVALSSVTARHC
ncbi:hypothetical protein RRG08_034945 [Elysia crispata]|uniref:Uncharacterized protein n=1 Tax=Elysia crispata TaxID=231223 RepID=A0AAE0Y1Z8_9GAST|nr:hypothetical protein RRG08_034945 [Elysia crispata]